MSKIHHPHNAKDQGQTDSEQRIGAAKDQHVDHMLEKLSHRALSRSTLTAR
jgi:hypothetical protein